jgi:hypothetical protein
MKILGIILIFCSFFIFYWGAKKLVMDDKCLKFFISAFLAIIASGLGLTLWMTYE